MREYRIRETLDDKTQIHFVPEYRDRINLLFFSFWWSWDYVWHWSNTGKPVGYYRLEIAKRKLEQYIKDRDFEINFKDKIHKP